MIYSASSSSSLSSRATTSISLQNKGTVDKQEVTVRRTRPHQYQYEWVWESQNLQVLLGPHPWGTGLDLLTPSSRIFPGSDPEQSSIQRGHWCRKKATRILIDPSHSSYKTCLPFHSMHIFYSLDFSYISNEHCWSESQNKNFRRQSNCRVLFEVCRRWRRKGRELSLPLPHTTGYTETSGVTSRCN